jgi:hypothetical protein
MVRISDFDPDAELHQVVGEVTQGLMNGAAISRNSLHWIGPDHGTEFLAVGVKVDGVRLVNPIVQGGSVGVAGLKGALP